MRSGLDRREQGSAAGRAWAVASEEGRGAGRAQTVCAGCYEAGTSVLSIAGHCSVCGAPLCYKCWGTGQRTCAEHGIETPVPETRRGHRPASASAVGRQTPAIGKKSAAHARCRRCGRETARKGFVLGRETYCPECQEELTRVPSELPEGAVTLDEARYLEALFHRFVADGLRKVAEANRGLVFRGKASQSGEWTSEELPEDFLSKHPCKDVLDGRLPSLPANRGVAYDVRSWERALKVLPRRRSTRLAAASYIPLAGLVEKGYATKPAGAKELMQALDGAPAQRPAVVRMVFSPTGWDESLALPENTALIGRNADGSWNVRASIGDERSAALVKGLFESESDGTKVERCVQAVYGLPSLRFPVSAARLAQEQDVPSHVALEAFRRIQRNERSFVLCEDPQNQDWLLDFS